MRFSRLPIQLTPGQTLVILTFVALVAVALLAAVLFEGLLTRLAAGVLRLTGHKMPAKSPARLALDDLEQRLRRRQA